MLESAPAAHRFRLSMLQPSEPRSFYSAVKREIKLLKSDLPPGVFRNTQINNNIQFINPLNVKTDNQMDKVLVNRSCSFD